MIKPSELLVITALSFGAATLHNTPASALGIRPSPARIVVGSFSAVIAAQTMIAAASTRARTLGECGLQGARDRARTANCG